MGRPHQIIRIHLSLRVIHPIYTVINSKVFINLKLLTFPNERIDKRLDQLVRRFQGRQFLWQPNMVQRSIYNQCKTVSFETQVLAFATQKRLSRTVVHIKETMPTSSHFLHPCTLNNAQVTTTVLEGSIYCTNTQYCNSGNFRITNFRITNFSRGRKYSL